MQLAQGKIDYTVGTQFHRQQSPTGTGSSLGLFLSVPLPVFNRNQGEVERARLEQRQLEQRLRAARAVAAADVESTYEQYAIASTMISNLEADMLEQSRQMLGGNTGTEVSNVELQAAVSFGCSDFDLLASGRIFQGVINQICEDLVDCIFVREDLNIRRCADLDR